MDANEHGIALINLVIYQKAINLGNSRDMSTTCHGKALIMLAISELMIENLS